MVFANALITSLLLGVEKDQDARDGMDTIDRHLLRSSGVNLPALASIDRCRLNLSVARPQILVVCHGSLATIRSGWASVRRRKLNSSGLTVLSCIALLATIQV